MHHSQISSGWSVISTKESLSHRSMLEESPLADHLSPADLITSINECKIQNQADWMQCLTQQAGAYKNISDASALTASQLLDLMSTPVKGPGFPPIPSPCPLLSSPPLCIDLGHLNV